MDARGKTFLAIGVVAFIAAAWGTIELGQLAATAMVANTPPHNAPPVTSDLPLAHPRVFSEQETKTFLAAVERAENIADPVQRCLAYPDPPGSHWSASAVHAYCQYRYQPIISLAEVTDLIEHGKAAELDQRLSDALQAQRTQPGAAGRLDRVFSADFDNDSFAVRSLLDAWKRDSPKSAFAYAASGYAYVAMAHAARGEYWIRNTQQENIDAMSRLVDEADTDLQQAVKLNPQITPAYIAMIHAGGLSLGRLYATRAGDAGLKVAPTDFSIYRQLMWLMTPEWGGSLQDMRHLATSGLAQAAQNPLLLLQKVDVPAYEANVRGCCNRPTLPQQFGNVFDELGTDTLMADAGMTAARQNLPTVAAVYLSEALRFNQDRAAERRARSRMATMLGVPQIAVSDANRLIASQPQDAADYRVRAYALMSSGDYKHAVPDLLTAIRLDPNNIWSQDSLGRIYVYSMGDWDKGWDVSNRLIQDHPDQAAGWILRASIQKRQPRAGLDDTLKYFIAHFSNDPKQQQMIGEMRRLQVERARTAKGGASISGSSPSMVAR